MLKKLNPAELLEAATRLTQFVVRHDLFAKQLPDGRYVCVRKPLKADLLVKHLEGIVTVGTYCLTEENCARFLVLDADTNESFNDLISAARRLKETGIPSYIELSRRGGHLWLFFDQPYSGRQVRELGLAIADTYQLMVEVFPKQDTVRKGVGSLIRLPFGRHCLSGKRYTFITLEGEYLAPTIREQLAILTEPAPVPVSAFERFKLPNSGREREVGDNDPALTALKAIPLVAFLGEYLALTPTPSGAVGRCPFHDDQVPSFAVNQDGNYWNCFVGCGGGTIIDFWMRWRGLDLASAIRELKAITGGKNE